MRIKGKKVKETDVLVEALVEYGNSTTARRPLIALYYHICDCYDNQLAYQCQRFSNNSTGFLWFKQGRGKAKMAVLNAVRNKIIHPGGEPRVFACVRDDRKYEKNYSNAPA